MVPLPPAINTLHLCDGALALGDRRSLISRIILLVEAWREVAPDGSYLQGPVFDEPCILTAELELSRVREESMSLDVVGHYHRPDCLKLVVRRSRR